MRDIIVSFVKKWHEKVDIMAKLKVKAIIFLIKTDIPACYLLKF